MLQTNIAKDNITHLAVKGLKSKLYFDIVYDKFSYYVNRVFVNEQK